MTGTRARIAGVGSYLPERVVTNEELCTTLDTTPEWIEQRTGIRERRFAAAGERTSDLAAAAARAALANAAIDAAQVDLVIVATSTPDNPQPATAARVHGLLGMRADAGSFDLNAVCSGFPYALIAGAGEVALDPGATVLVIGADTFSRVTDPADRTTRVFFGDGAAAAVLIAAEAHSDSGIIAHAFGTEPEGRDALIVPEYGDWFQMDGPAVKEYAERAMPTGLRVVCARAGISIADLALIVPHQSNHRILQSCAAALGVDEKVVHSTVPHYANTASASVGVALADAAAQGLLAPGDLVGLVGYGGGLSWAAAVIRWG